MAKVTKDDVVENTPIDLFDILGRDTDAEEAGAWFTLEYDGARFDSIQFKISSLSGANGKKFRRLQEQKELKAKAELDGVKELPIEVTNRIFAEAVVESKILIDWKGIYADRKEVPFTEAAKFLGHIKYDKALNFIILKASNTDEFRKAAKEELIKN